MRRRSALVARLGTAALPIALACAPDRSAPVPAPSAAPLSVPTPEGLPPGHPPIGGPAGAPRPGPSVSGTITLAPAVAGRRAASDVLYVIARQRESKVVVAVRREESPRFPHAFEISAADAMTQGQAFSGPFDITARLSKTGDAIPAPGDLEGTASAVAEGARGVAVQIDTVRQ